MPQGELTKSLISFVFESELECSLMVVLKGIIVEKLLPNENSSTCLQTILDDDSMALVKFRQVEE